MMVAMTYLNELSVEENEDETIQRFTLIVRKPPRSGLSTCSDVEKMLTGDEWFFDKECDVEVLEGR
jgi:hypothetical protein